MMRASTSIRRAIWLRIRSRKMRNLFLYCIVVFTLIKLFNRAPSSFINWEHYDASLLDSSLPRKGYALLINTWKRNDLLKESISHFASCPRLESIHVVWSEPDIPSDSLISFLEHVVKLNSIDGRDIELKFHINEENSLNNRFKEIKDLKSDVVFSIDDDIIIPCATVELAFQAWQSAPDTMVGFVPRVHRHNKLKGNMDKYTYSSWWSVWWTGTYNMILSKAAFFHKKYLSMYTYEMPASIREYVTENRNCEDIAMSFLVANATGSPPIWVQGKVFEIGATGLSSLGGHTGRRAHCLNWFAATYGRMPLVSTRVKVFDTRSCYQW